MNIVIVTNGYPNEKSRHECVFVQNLVWAWADAGHSCFVIRPVNIDKEVGIKADFHTTEYGGKVKVYFPSYRSMWMTSKGSLDIIAELGRKAYNRAVKAVITRENIKPDVLYGHFLHPAGTCVASLKTDFNVPAFVAFGESSLWSLGKNSISKKLQSILRRLDGVVSVSSYNKMRLVENGILSNEKIAVFPNGVNTERFHPMDQKECRKKLGFPLDGFIVSFAGHFSDRKGVLRVVDALRDTPEILIALAGKGELNPEAQNIIFKGVVPPENMAIFLNASDVFVLPTLNEGCCNAIVEAMACGLPIISSKDPFNDDILGENALRIDPKNISEIREAVLELKNDSERRNKMARISQEMAKSYEIKTRAEKIVSFMSRGIAK